MTLLAAVVSGIALGVSFPPNGWAWLEWIALAPLLLAVRGCGPLKGVLRGGVASLIASLLIFTPLRTPEAWGNAMGAAGVFAMLMLWTCAFGGAFKSESPARWACVVACAGVVGEWMTHAVFPVDLALGQWRNGPLLQIAGWTGIWGVSFLLYLVNAAAALLMGSFATRRHPTVRFALALAAVIGVVELWGAASHGGDPVGRTVRVAALQPGDEDAGPLSIRARGLGARIVVWPEESLPAADARDLKRLALPGVVQVVGYSEPALGDALPENRAVMIDPQGRLVGYYNKIHLFGTEAGLHRAGKALPVLRTPFGPAGMAICFDTMYTDVVRGLVRGGARAIFLPNQDPDAGRDSIQALHLAATAFRAAENGVPIVRADWRVDSAIVDTRGRVVARLGSRAPDLVVADVTIPDHAGTPYTRMGDVFPWLCLIGLVGLGAWEIAEERRSRRRAFERRETAAPGGRSEPYETPRDTGPLAQPSARDLPP